MVNHPNRSKKRLTVSQLTIEPPPTVPHGPFIVEPDTDWPLDDLAIVSADGNTQIAAILGNGHNEIAIANLFAAAPDVLKTLRELQKLGEQSMTSSYDEWLAFHDKVAQLASDAIAKATGEARS